MKHKIFLCVLIGSVVLFCCSVSYSANVEMPSAKRGKPEIKLGLNSFKRKIKYESGEISPTSKTGRIESDQYFIRGKYGILDRLEVYADYGSADMVLDYDNTSYDDEWDRDGFWGIGLAGIILKTENGVKMGFDAHYARGEHDLKDLKGYAPGTVTFTGNMKWKEWHTALFVSKDFKYLEPFAGVKYSDYRHRQNADIGLTVGGGGATVVEDLDYKSRENFGVFVGTKLNFNESIALTVQGRFLDEEGIGCSLGYRF